jgi:autotransporter-associated beta strand protein
MAVKISSSTATSPLIKTGAGAAYFFSFAADNNNANWTHGLDIQQGSVIAGASDNSRQIGTGPVTLASGTSFSISTNFAISLPAGNTFTVAPNASVTFSVVGTGAKTINGLLTLGSGSTATIENSAAGAFNISGGLSGAGNITKTGTTTVNLSGSGTGYTGTVTPSAGTLSVGATSVLANALLSPSTGTFSWSSGAAIGGLTGSTAFSLGTVNLTIGSSSQGTVTYSGALGGTSAVLTKTGTNTQILSGPGTRTTGNTAINAGVIRLTNANGLYGASGSGRTTVASGNVAALELTNGISTPATAPLTLNASGITSGGALRNVSGANTYGGSILLGSAASITADAGSLNIKAVDLAGNGLTVTPASGASITLGGSVSSATASSAVTISGLGTVFGGIANFISLGAATNGTTVSGALDAAGFNASLGALAGAGTITTAPAARRSRVPSRARSR